MTAPGRVLVAVADETLALRLRLMVEAEGGETVTLAEVTALGGGSIALALVSAELAGRARHALPEVPVRIVEGGEWSGIRDSLATVLAPAGDGVSEGDEMVRALAQARILLVDDSVTYREFLRLELSRLGAEVVTCAAAGEAMALLGRGGWDCVLVDLVMPGVDGIDLCARAARLRRRRGQGFLLGVLSSREGKADLLRSLEAGADMFLGKSQDMAVFRARLGAMLRRRFLNNDEPPVW
jgi:Response regulators consisting of a CheY-like receiver domain and a winged-helix DNA-binding domain